MKLLIVDDHTLFRDGLSLLVRLEFPDVQLLEADSLEQAQQQLATHDDTHLILLDLALPDAAGLHALLALRAAHEGTRCVVLSAENAPDVVLSAIEAGASGFIPKTTQARHMLQALRVVLAGGIYLPPDVLARRSAQNESDSEDPLARLSERQMDVLRLLIEGKSNKQIGRELDLSDSTVKTHMEAIFRRLAVNSRTQAVVVAASLGLSLSHRR